MSRIKAPLSLLLMAAAALASFYLAMHWLRSFSSRSDDVVDVVVSQRREPPASVTIPAQQESAQKLDLSLAPTSRNMTMPEGDGEAFMVKSWLPPPPPVVAVAPPPPVPSPVPVAPPLPFTFVGMIEKNTAHPQAFLAKGEMLLIVGAGDLIDNNTYRVDSLNLQQIVMTYLPLNTHQTLNILGAMK